MKQLRQKKKTPSKKMSFKNYLESLMGILENQNTINFTGKKGKIQLVLIKRKGQTTHSKGTTMRLGARFKDED